MSLHYEWVISLRLRQDLPADALAEVRWHLGLEHSPPATRKLDESPPVFVEPETGWMPGGHLAVLKEQDSPDGPSLGMFVRTLVLDDGMYELLEKVPRWFAGVSATEGWIGMAREEMNLEVWLNFYVQGGQAYAAGPGEPPHALADSAPAFTLTQTRW